HRLEALLAFAQCGFRPTTLGPVTEDQDHADDLATLVEDRGGAVVDGPLVTITSQQYRVVRQPDGHTVSKDAGDGVFGWASRLLMEDRNPRRRRPRGGVGATPAGRGLGCGVHKRDPPLGIGGNARVPDAGERPPPCLRLLADERGRPLLFGDIAG